MPIRKNRKDDERFYQREFLKAFENFANAQKIFPFINVDEDSPQRVFKSGYDFSISLYGRIIFFETKVSDAKTENYDIFNKLEDYQKVTMKKILISSGTYGLLEWNYTKKTYILYLLAPSSQKVYRFKTYGIAEIMEKVLSYLKGFTYVS